MSFRDLFISSNFKNFFLGSARGREARDTRRLLERAQAAWRKLPIADEDARIKFLAGTIREICSRADRFPADPLLYATTDLVRELFDLDGLSAPPDLGVLDNLTFEEGVRLRRQLHSIIRFGEDWERLSTIWRDKITAIGKGILDSLPASAFGESDREDEDDPLRALSVPLIDLCEEPGVVVWRTMATLYDDDVTGAKLFEDMRVRFEHNLCDASSIPYAERHTSSKKTVLPPEYKAKSNAELVDVYLGGTPFAYFLGAPVPFSIPFPARFEHTHIVGGTGHGKTQLMQAMIYHDLIKAAEDGRSMVIMDSQGDLIRTISRLNLFASWTDRSLADRILIVDPNDVEYPACLNLFDWNRERMKEYGALEREKLLNSAIELYEYLFGALLGAELTQRQGLIFKYLARLMMEIPDATIRTLQALMENGEPFRPYMERLPGSARSFFETRFFDKSFNETKKQILTRLWGVMSNATLERMFTHPRNKVDMFDSLNSGKIVLINTAKDLLKQDGCAIFGRFFIALIVQAAMERSSISPHARNPAFIYIDEAQDYFDENIGNLLNQARKYRIGMVLAHQNLDQLSVSLRSSIFASTSIKFAGGVSAKDARVLADEMRCDDEILLGTRKRAHHTEFVSYVRNLTPHGVKVTVPLGAVEAKEMIDRSDYEALIDGNRARYAVRAAEFALPAPSAPAPQPSTAAPEPSKPPQETPKKQSRAPASAAAPPPPVIITSPPKKPPAEPPTVGRGGRQHKYLQHLIKTAAEERGFRALIEETISDGAGRVDVLLAKGKQRIACEISVTTGSEHELQNVEKCLAAGFNEVILVVPDERQRKAMRTFIVPNLEEKDAEKVAFLLPEEVLARLDELSGAPEPTESTVRGYKVKVTRTAVDTEEAKARRQAIAEVLARSLKRTRDEKP